MKVVLDDCVYMKLNDVRDLVHSGILPAYFLTDISKRGIGYYNNEQYLRFDNRDEINELRHLDFIIDYNEYVDVPIEKVEMQIAKLTMRRIELLKKYQSGLSFEEQIDKNAILKECKALGLQISSLNKLATIKKQEELALVKKIKEEESFGQKLKRTIKKFKKIK